MTRLRQNQPHAVTHLINLKPPLNLRIIQIVDALCSFFLLLFFNVGLSYLGFWNDTFKVNGGNFWVWDMACQYGHFAYNHAYVLRPSIFASTHLTRRHLFKKKNNHFWRIEIVSASGWYSTMNVLLRFTSPKLKRILDTIFN